MLLHTQTICKWNRPKVFWIDSGIPFSLERAEQVYCHVKNGDVYPAKITGHLRFALVNTTVLWFGNQHSNLTLLKASYLSIAQPITESGIMEYVGQPILPQTHQANHQIGSLDPPTICRYIQAAPAVAVAYPPAGRLVPAPSPVPAPAAPAAPVAYGYAVAPEAPRYRPVAQPQMARPYQSRPPNGYPVASVASAYPQTVRPSYPPPQVRAYARPPPHPHPAYARHAPRPHYAPAPTPWQHGRPPPVHHAPRPPHPYYAQRPPSYPHYRWQDRDAVKGF